jgi:histidinol dehydrogenase
MRIWRAEEELEGLLLDVKAKREEGRREVREAVQEVKSIVLEKGEEGIVELSKRFDGWVDRLPLRVGSEEMEQAFLRVAPEDRALLRRMIRRVAAYHKTQRRRRTVFRDGIVRVVDSFVPIEKVLVYVPSGSAPYFSSLVMATVPAKIAGVSEIMVTTPARGGRVHDLILTACKLLGVEKVFRIGGAQAVYAFAYGVGVPRVDMVVGPGNAYVEEAKRDVFGIVGIDMPAGPTELFVLCMDWVDTEAVAWDLLSQAEHDEFAVIGLFSRAEEQIAEVYEKANLLSRRCDRRDRIQRVLEGRSVFAVFEKEETAVGAINAIAPEHLEIMGGGGLERGVLYPGVTYVGPHAHVSLGDYFVGTNHILPTSGAGRFLGGLSVDSFLRRKVVVRVERGRALLEARRLAELEGFLAHAEAIAVRGRL